MPPTKRKKHRYRTGPKGPHAKKGPRKGQYRPGLYLTDSATITADEQSAHKCIAEFEARIAGLKRRLWDLKADNFTKGTEEKKKVNATLRLAVEHLKAAKAQVKAAAVAARAVTRRIN